MRVVSEVLRVVRVVRVAADPLVVLEVDLVGPERVGPLEVLEAVRAGRVVLLAVTARITLVARERVKEKARAREKVKARGRVRVREREKEKERVRDLHKALLSLLDLLHLRDRPAPLDLRPLLQCRTETLSSLVLP